MSGAQVIPAPVGGWNARDSLEAMDPSDAVQLDNFIPGNGVVMGRGGSKSQLSSAIADAVDTLMPYEGSASTHLLAGANGHIYTVANGATFISPASLGSGFASDTWQFGMFNDTMVLVNGTDAAQKYDGTTLSALTLTQLATPVNGTFTLNATGTLATGTYWYRISAINANGETLASTQTSFSIISGPKGINLTWGAVTGATGYNIYGRTNGTEQLIASVAAPTLTYTDDGTITPSGALPGANTTNVSPSLLVDVVNFKGRAFYIETASSRFWYAAAGGFQGMLTKFDLSTVTQRGGTLTELITWTRDSNDGVDDLCAFIFSTGEVLVYQGTDPSNANLWFMVGRYFIGAPLGRRAHAKFASTEVILTTDGFQTLDEAIQNLRIELVDSFAGKIFRACSAAAQQFKANFGWQAIYYPRGNMFLANVPLAADNFQQYVRNTNTSMWCRFTGWNARCLAIYMDRLYFGTNDGQVKLADVQTADNTRQAYSDDGAAIGYNALTAYATFGQPGLKTQISSAQLTMANITDGKVISLNAFADFHTRSLPDVPAPVEITPGQWDQSPWDTDGWAATNIADAGATQTRIFWRPIQIRTGFATAISLRMKSVLQNPLWYSTKYIFNQAGVN